MTVLKPRRAHLFAATEPPGPPPTTITSNIFDYPFDNVMRDAFINAFTLSTHPAWTVCADQNVQTGKTRGFAGSTSNIQHYDRFIN
jgi:hypothetical protein